MRIPRRPLHLKEASRAQTAAEKSVPVVLAAAKLAARASALAVALAAVALTRRRQGKTLK